MMAVSQVRCVDPSGASVAGATVTVKNERTGAANTVTADGGGRYVVTGLAPSTYTITVTAGNFARSNTPRCGWRRRSLPSI
jgi:hypothetical protein